MWEKQKKSLLPSLSYSNTIDALEKHNKIKYISTAEKWMHILLLVGINDTQKVIIAFHLQIHTRSLKYIHFIIPATYKLTQLQIRTNSGSICTEICCCEKPMNNNKEIFQSSVNKLTMAIVPEFVVGRYSFSTILRRERKVVHSLEWWHTQANMWGTGAGCRNIEP